LGLGRDDLRQDIPLLVGVGGGGDYPLGADRDAEVTSLASLGIDDDIGGTRVLRRFHVFKAPFHRSTGDNTPSSSIMVAVRALSRCEKWREKAEFLKIMSVLCVFSQLNVVIRLDRAKGMFKNSKGSASLKFLDLALSSGGDG
jgi:hypothetical protein